jgi:hypothetical protein
MSRWRSGLHSIFFCVCDFIEHINRTALATISVSVIHKLLLVRGLRHYWLDDLRIRGLRILLFPVVAPLFLLGWVLYVIGERQACSKAVTEGRNDNYRLAGKPNVTEDNFEMGLIDEIMEDKLQKDRVP